MGIQGVAVAALCVLVFGILVPWSVRGRVLLADARMEDRTSQRMHLVAVGGTVRDSAMRRRSRCSRSSGRKAALVTRPADLTRASAADARHLAVARARLAARRSRRAAGRKRRTTLNVSLIVATVVVLTLGLVTALSAWWTVLPLIASSASLVASRRADLAASQRDRNDEAELDAMEERLTIAMERARQQREERDRQLAAVRQARVAAELRAQREEQRAIEAAEAAARAAEERELERAREEWGEYATVKEPALVGASVSGEQAAVREEAAQPQPVLTQPVTIDVGWTPTAVPAPVYTYKAKARRAVDPYRHDEEAEKGSVPMRPTTLSEAKAPLGSAARELIDHREQRPPADTIDLARVLEDRRARGA